MAAAHITGTRKENQRNFSGGTLAVSTDVLIDIEKKLSEGKSKSYEQWAKVFNIKQMANALLILREEGIGSTGQLEERLAAATSAFELSSDQLKATESEFRELRRMKQHILDYGRTREFFQNTRSAANHGNILRHTGQRSSSILPPRRYLKNISQRECRS